jgi:hypothetical protein
MANYPPVDKSRDCVARRGAGLVARVRGRTRGNSHPELGERHGSRRIVVVLLSDLPAGVVATILVFEVIGLIIVLRLRVVEPTPSLPAPNVG